MAADPMSLLSKKTTTLVSLVLCPLSGRHRSARLTGLLFLSQGKGNVCSFSPRRPPTASMASQDSVEPFSPGLWGSTRLGRGVLRALSFADSHSPSSLEPLPVVQQNIGCIGSEEGEQLLSKLSAMTSL